jgi:hypothetical protein
VLKNTSSVIPAKAGIQELNDQGGMAALHKISSH